MQGQQCLKAVVNAVSGLHTNETHVKQAKADACASEPV